MSHGPDWNWIGYMNSFDDGGGGGGCGCLVTLLIMIVSAVLWATVGR